MEWNVSAQPSWGQVHQGDVKKTSYNENVGREYVCFLKFLTPCAPLGADHLIPGGGGGAMVFL